MRTVSKLIIGLTLMTGLMSTSLAGFGVSGDAIISGNLNIGGGVSLNGTISANKFVGSGALLTGVISAPSTNVVTNNYNGNVSINGFVTLNRLSLPATTATNGQIWLGATQIHAYGSDASNGNFFVGPSAANASMSGQNNIAIGYQSLHSNTTGYQNNALGSNTMYSNTDGFFNNAFGTDALRLNTTGFNNNALGPYALENNTTGQNNNALGRMALYMNLIGYQNTAFGPYALNQLGNDGVPEGSQNDWDYSNNIAIGYSAGGDDDNGPGLRQGQNNIFIGRTAGERIEHGNNNVMIGHNAGPTTQQDMSDKLYINNDQSDAPLIWGDFDAKILSLNGMVNFGSDANFNDSNRVFFSAPVDLGNPDNTRYEFHNSAGDFHIHRINDLGFDTYDLHIFQNGEWIINDSDYSAGTGYRFYINSSGSEPNGALGVSGNMKVNGEEKISGYLHVDVGNNDDGSSGSAVYHGINFGESSGEAIGSDRQGSSLSQYGLDFYTDFSKRMSIINGGNVGIGTEIPTTTLEVAGTVSASELYLGATHIHTFGTIESDPVGDPGNYSANFFAGPNAGNASMTGVENIGMGFNALAINETGDHNNAMGRRTLQLNTSGSDNNAFGAWALNNNITGAENNALGRQALAANIDGGYNNAFGGQALNFNTSGAHNNAIGYSSLGYNFIGFQNTAIGPYALDQLGNDGVPAGSQADTDYSNNIAIGYSAGGGDNMGPGLRQGENNIFIGRAAGERIEHGNNNVMIGHNAGPTAQQDMSDKLYIHNDQSDTPLIYGDFSVGRLDVNAGLIIGAANIDPVGDPSPLLDALPNTGKLLIAWNRSAGRGETDFYANRGGGSDGGYRFYNYDNDGTETHLVSIESNGNVGIGVLIPTSKLEVDGDVVATNFVGNGSGLTGVGSGSVSTNVVTKNFNGNVSVNGVISANSFIGSGSGLTNLSLSTNVVTKNFNASVSLNGTLSTNWIALPASTTTNGQLWLGTTRIHATSLGFFAGPSAGNTFLTGQNNYGIGASSLAASTSGGFNNAFGYSALQNNTTQNYNNAFGYLALQASFGNYNIGFGYSGGRFAYGDFNSFFGYQADVQPAAAVLQNATAIGKNAKVATSNALILGGYGVDAVRIGIGTATPSYTLEVVGTVNASAVTANYFYGNGSMLTGISSGTSTNVVTINFNGSATVNGTLLARQYGQWVSKNVLTAAGLTISTSDGTILSLTVNASGAITLPAANALGSGTGWSLTITLITNGNNQTVSWTGVDSWLNTDNGLPATSGQRSVYGFFSDGATRFGAQSTAPNGDLSIAGTLTANLVRAIGISVNGTVSANFFIGNGSLLSGVSSGTSTNVVTNNFNGSVSLNGTVSISALAVNGTVAYQLVSKNATYTAANEPIIFGDASSGAMTINLPAAASCRGRTYTIKKVDSSGNTVTIDGNGAETIDGAATVVIAVQYNSYTIISNGTNWYIL